MNLEGIFVLRDTLPGKSPRAYSELEPAIMNESCPYSEIILASPNGSSILDSVLLNHCDRCIGTVFVGHVFDRCHLEFASYP